MMSVWSWWFMQWSRVSDLIKAGEHPGSSLPRDEHTKLPGLAKLAGGLAPPGEWLVSTPK